MAMLRDSIVADRTARGTDASTRLVEVRRVAIFVWLERITHSDSGEGWIGPDRRVFHAESEEWGEKEGCTDWKNICK